MNLKNLAIACIFIAFSSKAMDRRIPHLTGITLPHVEKVVKSKRYLDISSNYQFIQKDLRSEDEGCGYDSLYTRRKDVYGVIKELYLNRWDDLQEGEQDVLKHLINGCAMSYGWRMKYEGLKNWPELDKFCQLNIINNSSTTLEMLELICYIKGWNLTVFYDLESRHYMSRQFSRNWETKYLLFVNESIGHWEVLVPRE